MNSAKWSTPCTFALLVLASFFSMFIYFVIIPLNINGLTQSTNRATTSISVVIIVLAVIGAILVMACLISVMCLLNNFSRFQRNAANANAINPVYSDNQKPPPAYPTVMPASTY